MRAFRVDRPGAARLVDLAPPVPAADEVLVRVDAVGICGSDLELVKGTRDRAFSRYPIVPGHEFAGVVVSRATTAPELTPGTAVVVEGHRYCRACEACLAGRTQLCARYDEFGFTRDGGYAEMVACRVDLCHPLTRAETWRGALAEPTACALHAVERSAIGPDDVVAVIGGGPIGLLVAACAAVRSPRRVLVADVRDTTLPAARALGATDVLCTTSGDMPTAVTDLLGQAPTVVVEAAGHPEAQRAASTMLARGGRLAVLGLAGVDRTTPGNFDPLVFRDARVDAVFAYPSATFGRAVRLIDDGVVDPSPLITHRLPLSATVQALALLEQRREPAIKVLLDPRA